jgi:diguanylate cyclase (GGDEF)-like protein
VIRDITDRRRAEEEIRYHAFHDVLTGLPNRMLLEDRLALALANARRESHHLALMFLDLDRFKEINDTYGHLAGDHLLQEVAYRLIHRLREGDTIARIGGDEFIILLPVVQRKDDVVPVAEKVLQCFADPFQVCDQKFQITPSIGIAIYPQDGSDATALMANADTALYQAKAQGRNTYQVFAEDGVSATH